MAKPEFDPLQPQEYLQSGRLAPLIQKCQELQALEQMLQQMLSPELGPQVYVMNYHKGRLLLGVLSAAWLKRLQFFRPQLLAQLAYHPLGKNVQQLEFKIQPAAAPAKKPAQSTRCLTPRTRQLLTNTAQTVQNAELKEALLKLSKD